MFWQYLCLTLVFFILFLPYNTLENTNDTNFSSGYHPLSFSSFSFNACTPSIELLNGHNSSFGAAESAARTEPDGLFHKENKKCTWPKLSHFSELWDRSIDISELHKACVSPDCKALKLRKCRSGKRFGSLAKLLLREMQLLPNSIGKTQDSSRWGKVLFAFLC